MCGIAGISLNPADQDRIDTTRLVTALLHAIETRGRDAAGVAWADPHGTLWYQKSNIPARSLTPRLDPNLRTVRNVICHTRWATKGTPENNDNNHPIVTGGLVGVHNGQCSNDDELFNRIGPEKRIAQVDSEAIFALLAHGPEVFGEPDPVHHLPKIAGTAAIAWLTANDPTHTMQIARVRTSPLTVGQTRNGSLVFASTRQLLTRACQEADVNLTWVHDVNEGTYLKVREGLICEHRTFTVTSGYRHRNHDYRTPSRWEPAAR